MSQRIAVVYEAINDFIIATGLADRALAEAVEGLEDWIQHSREWIATDTHSTRLTWSAVAKLAKSAGINTHGKFDDKPGEPDAKAARRAILYLKKEHPTINAVVLIRDQDDQPRRRLGLRQARSAYRDSMPIVISLAIVELESWIISGFEPNDEQEHRRLREERQRLGLDPREKSHELSACKNDQALRSPKRVLKSLSNGDRERVRQCWTRTSLDVLRRRGAENGLREYLDDIQQLLAPLFRR